MKEHNTYGISIKNQLDEFTFVVKEVEKACADWHVSSKIINQLNLAIEEAVSNIIFYAFEDVNEHIISIILSFYNKNITVQITDDGKAFNILNVDKGVDIKASVEDRNVGGLGIYLLRKMVDNIEYQRVANQNILKLTKNI